MSAHVTLFSHDDLYMLFRVLVAVEFGAVALAIAGLLDALRHSRVRVRRR